MRFRVRWWRGRWYVPATPAAPRYSAPSGSAVLSEKSAASAKMSDLNRNSLKVTHFAPRTPPQARIEATHFSANDALSVLRRNTAKLWCPHFCYCRRASRAMAVGHLVLHHRGDGGSGGQNEGRQLVAPARCRTGIRGPLEDARGASELVRSGARFLPVSGSLRTPVQRLYPYGTRWWVLFLFASAAPCCALQSAPRGLHG